MAILFCHWNLFLSRRYTLHAKCVFFIHKSLSVMQREKYQKQKKTRQKLEYVFTKSLQKQHATTL